MEGKRSKALTILLIVVAWLMAIGLAYLVYLKFMFLYNKKS
jgi:flagellar basal body-associated protein FliL